MNKYQISRSARPRASHPARSLMKWSRNSNRSSKTVELTFTARMPRGSSESIHQSRRIFMDNCPDHIKGGCANPQVKGFLCDPSQCGKTNPQHAAVPQINQHVGLSEPQPKADAWRF